MARDPQTVQQEIEQSRDALAATLDQLADRASPKHVAERAKSSIVQKAKSPAGMAVLGGATGLVAILLIRRFRS